MRCSWFTIRVYFWRLSKQWQNVHEEIYQRPSIFLFLPEEMTKILTENQSSIFNLLSIFGSNSSFEMPRTKWPGMISFTSPCFHLLTLRGLDILKLWHGSEWAAFEQIRGCEQLFLKHWPLYGFWMQVWRKRSFSEDRLLGPLLKQSQPNSNAELFLLVQL